MSSQRSSLDNMYERPEYEYRFKGYEYIPHNDERSIDVFINIYEAETIKEFRELNNLSKKELIDWLNKNYNR